MYKYESNREKKIKERKGNGTRAALMI